MIHAASTASRVALLPQPSPVNAGKPWKITDVMNSPGTDAATIHSRSREGATTSSPTINPVAGQNDDTPLDAPMSWYPHHPRATYPASAPMR